MYAIVESGGKQYKVEVGKSLLVDRVGLSKGDTLELDRVLLVRDGDLMLVGKPTVEGARVLATVRGDVKGPKVIVQKFKAKSNYHVKIGHRQLYTDVSVKEIVLPSKEGR